jgi:hypothetical protein
MNQSLSRNRETSNGTNHSGFDHLMICTSINEEEDAFNIEN